MQTSSPNFTNAAAPVAGPLVIDGVDPAAAPGSHAPAVVVDGSAPGAVAVAEPVAVAVEAIPVAATKAPPRSGGEYPNINVTPAQPTGTLMPPDERKRVISELEAMRAGQAVPIPATTGSAALNAELQNRGAEALKKIEECSQEGAAETDPDCAPAD